MERWYDNININYFDSYETNNLPVVKGAHAYSYRLRSDEIFNFINRANFHQLNISIHANSLQSIQSRPILHSFYDSCILTYIYMLSC